MLIIALVLAVIGLAALVAAVVTSNELIAWVCIGASVIGVLLLIVDALRDRSRRNADDDAGDAATDDDATGQEAETAVQDYPDEETAEAPEVADTDTDAPDAELPQRAEVDVEHADAEHTAAEHTDAKSDAEPKS
ncbi:hypothetical protein [Mycolicibacterium sp. J2]|jgi:hypothetical protein|uniref:hypothetical protein n=1 Tax=Mycolicibacterium sp. J2 TaxID=2993511 RepID=UPI00224A4F1E|nr:hypothetical protein [Mycolicibacterium sp. J2]MCX2713919.1 hypothetical protein [Mycolicibacterium sp. J2]